MADARFSILGPYENNEKHSIVLDDLAGGDPLTVATIAKIHRPDELHRMCELANAALSTPPSDVTVRVEEIAPSLSMVPDAYEWRIRGGTFPPNDDPWSYIDYHTGLLIAKHPEKYETRALYAAISVTEEEIARADDRVQRFYETWPPKLSPKVIASCAGGGVTCDQITHIYGLVRASMTLQMFEERSEDGKTFPEKGKEIPKPRTDGGQTEHEQRSSPAEVTYEAIEKILRDNLEIHGVSDEWERPTIEGVFEAATTILSLLSGEGPL